MDLFESPWGIIMMPISSRDMSNVERRSDETHDITRAQPGGYHVVGQQGGRTYPLPLKRIPLIGGA